MATQPHSISNRAATLAIELPDSRRLARRITVIWGLLFFNGLPFQSASILPLPQRIAQLMTAGALVLALLLTLQLNPRMHIRPNVVLTLATLLAATAFVTSIRGTAGVGALFRCIRLDVYLFVLWLLTPWWGRRDLLFARCHLRVLIGVLASVMLGVAVAPSLALGGRLIGVIWPIPAPQVGEFAALTAGIAIVLWLSGALARRPALALTCGGLVVTFLTETRTSLIGLCAGLVLAIASLLLTHRRVRHALTAALIAAPLLIGALAPAFTTWFARDQSTEELHGLTGRTQVWTDLVAQPRTEFNRWFGFGLGDKSFDGRPIDSTWLAAYHEQGLVGDCLIAMILLFLFIAIGFAPAGPARAIALFLVVYCSCASYTEVGLGDATPYLLHIVVAASLLVSRDDETAVAATQ